MYGKGVIPSNSNILQNKQLTAMSELQFLNSYLAVCENGEERVISWNKLMSYPLDLVRNWRF